MDKFYFYLNEDDLEESVKQYNNLKSSNPDLNFMVIVSKDFVLKDSEQDCQNLIKLLNEFNISNKNITFSVSTKEHNFYIDEWEKIKKLNQFLEKYKVGFGFEDMKKTWSISEVEKANSSILDSAKKIKSQNYSSFEKLLSAYLKVTQRQYNKERKAEHHSISRSVYGVLNSNKIVCVGYAELLEAILNEVGDENIKVYQNHVCCSANNKNQDCTHRTLIVYLKDEKYGIDGYYYLDPTLDCKEYNSYIPKLTHFLVPIGDIKNLKYHIRSNGYLTKKTKSKSSTQSVYNDKKKETMSWTSDELEVTNEFMQDYIKQNNIEEPVGEIVGRKPLSSYIKQKIYDSSKPISIDSELNGLFNILRNSNPHCSKEELYDFISKTLSENCELAQQEFNSDSKFPLANSSGYIDFSM